MTRRLSTMLPVLFSGGLLCACATLDDLAGTVAAPSLPPLVSKRHVAVEADDAGSAFGPIEPTSHRTIAEPAPAPAEPPPIETTWALQVRQAAGFAKEAEPAAVADSGRVPAPVIAAAAETATGLIALLASHFGIPSGAGAGASAVAYREEKRNGLEKGRDFFNLALPFAQDTPLRLGVQMNGITLGVKVSN